MGFLPKLFGGSGLAGRDPLDDINYAVPQGWSSESLGPGQGVLLLASDIEADWQANLFLEIRQDHERRSLPQTLEDLGKNLKDMKLGFRLISAEEFRNANEMKMARIEYTAETDGVPLTEWKIAIQLSLVEKLHILASSATECWPKYKPIFEAFVNSITVRQEDI